MAAAAAGGGGGNGSNRNANNNSGSNNSGSNNEPDHIFNFRYGNNNIIWNTQNKTLHVDAIPQLQREAMDIDLNEIHILSMSAMRNGNQIYITGIYDSGEDGVGWGESFNNMPLYEIVIEGNVYRNRNPYIQGDYAIDYQSIKITKLTNPSDEINQHIAARGSNMDTFLDVFITPDDEIDFVKFVRYLVGNIMNFQTMTLHKDVLPGDARMRLEIFMAGLARDMMDGYPLDFVEPLRWEPVPAPIGNPPPFVPVAQNQNNNRNNRNNNNNGPAPQWFQNVLAAAGGGGGIGAGQNVQYPNNGQRVVRNLPANATNSLTYEEIADGTNMVNFQGEGALADPRHYTRESFNAIQRYVHPHGAVVANTGYKLNPFTKQRIQPENVTRYTARVAAAAGNQQGGVQRLKKRRATHKRRSAKNKRRVTHKRRGVAKK
jgi:hypothetical protein